MNAAGARNAGLPVVLPVAVTVLVAALLVVLAVVWAAKLSDDYAVSRQASLFSTAVEDRLDDMVREQSVAVDGDAAATTGVLDIDGRDRLHDRLGGWLSARHGHDFVFLLDGSGRPVYASEGGAMIEPGVFERLRGTLAPLVETARAAIEAKTSAIVDGDAAGAVGADETSTNGAADVVVSGGRPALAAVAAIGPETAGLIAAERQVLVSLAFLDADLLGEIGRGLQLNGAHLRAVPPNESGWAVEPLTARGGGPALGFLTWRPDRPGDWVRTHVLPTAVVAMAVVAAVTALLLFKLGTASTADARRREEIDRMVEHDPLTDLPNRRLLEARLEAALEARDGRLGVAVHYVDLDDFKSFNDTHGHGAGDQLLVEVGRRLERLIGADDLVARLGGDEFVVLQTSVLAAAEAKAFGVRISEALCQPMFVGIRRLAVAGSVGTAVSFDRTIGADDLFRRADLALYASKADRDNRHTMFEQAMEDSLRLQSRLQADLAHALDAGLLEVWYQPIVTADTGRVQAMEALARWRHPERGYVPAPFFVRLAEENGQIVRLGTYVLRRACADAVAWDGAWLFVNASPTELSDIAYVDGVRSALALSGLAPERLCIEVTEHAFRSENDQTLSVLAALRAMGVRIMLDDFGTGYSSLSRLRELPVDGIKIDRAFVTDVSGDPNGSAILSAIADLGRALGLFVIIEGIETEAERSVALATGAAALQGFLFAQPRPAVEFDFGHGAPMFGTPVFAVPAQRGGLEVELGEAGPLGMPTPPAGEGPRILH
jgi:diguanylate cyclase (GGDEF)-like protein